MGGLWRNASGGKPLMGVSGHSILYVPMINLIQCMGGMALIPKSCSYYAKNVLKIAIFKMIFGPFGARYYPLYYTRNPMIDCFTVETFHNVCSKEKSDSLYGYYGCNGKNVLKNRSFFVIFEIFGA